MSAELPEPVVSPPGPAPDRYLGCTIDNRYKVESIVGEGGMGVVYQCRHTIIDKRVALKILRADLARDTEVTERFLMEAKAASAIQDEHIISISDFGQLPDGAAYFVMEFLEGTPLALIAGGGVPMALPRILRIALQLSEGLGAAHQLGIVHRDLKPDNVFLIQRGKEADFVKILDFGIAKVSSVTGGRLTQAGSVFGTPHYMSPEQAAGTPLDQRGDIYSLGVMLYELATGRVPFDAENFVGILSQQLYTQPVPPRRAAPQAKIPAAFEAIILKCMEKKPERRYQTMSLLREDLLELEAELGLASSRDSRKPEDHSGVLASEGTAVSTELTLANLRPRRWPLYAAIVAPVAVFVGIFGTQLGSRAGAERARAAEAEAVPLRAAPEPSPSELMAPSTGSDGVENNKSARAPVQVLLGAAPTTAHVFLEGRDLGVVPVPIDVPAGSTVTVEVRHKGYDSREITLDGSEQRVAVPLTKTKKKKKKGAKSRLELAADLERRSPSSVELTPPKRPPPPDDSSAGGQLFMDRWQKP